MVKEDIPMARRRLTEQECLEVKGGEAITLATVMAFLAIGLIAVIAFKFFTSGEGKAVFPGGFTFQWK